MKSVGTSPKNLLCGNNKIFRITGFNPYSSKTRPISVSDQPSKSRDPKEHQTKFNRTPHKRIVRNYKRSLHSSVHGSKDFGKLSMTAKNGFRITKSGQQSPKLKDSHIDNYIKKIGELESNLEYMVSENKKLKLLSKEIMKKQEAPSTIHSFYQNIILADNQQNISQLKNEIEILKAKTIKLTLVNNKLRKENKRLESLLLNYRELCKQPITNEQHIEISIKKNLDLKNEDSTSVLNCSKATILVSQEDMRLNTIIRYIKKIATVNSIKELINVLYTGLSILVKPSKVGLFIINTELQRLYQKEKGEIKTITVDKAVVDYVIHDIPTFTMSPIFANIEDAAAIIRKPDAISIPISDLTKSELYFVVQLEATQDEYKSIHARNLLVLCFIKV